MKTIILELIQKRDQEFIERFCQAGTFLSADGSEIQGVCKPIEANEMMNFMHVHDALIIDVLKNK